MLAGKKNILKEDKKKANVLLINSSRSKLLYILLDLLDCGAITLDDLSDFSDKLKEDINSIYNHKNK